MRDFGSSVLTWSHRTLTLAVGRGSRLLARLAPGSDSGGRRTEQGRVGTSDLAVSSGDTQQSDAAPAASRARETAPTPAAQRQRPVAARRATTAPVAPAVVRSWANEQGIQVSDRGQIPRPVMERYLAEVVRTV